VSISALHVVGEIGSRAAAMTSRIQIEPVDVASALQGLLVDGGGGLSPRWRWPVGQRLLRLQRSVERIFCASAPSSVAATRQTDKRS
jgi:hypothetical protein